MTMFTMTAAEVRDSITDCFEAGVVPFVTSSPGLGKSSIYRAIAKAYNLQLIDLRLSQCAPEDLMGLPMRVGEGSEMRATFAPFITFPVKDDPLPKDASGEDMNGWLLLLDEFNSGTKMVQAAAYKVVLDRMVGQAELHDAVFIGCAGNLATDRAIVNSLSTAMQSRLIHIEMEVSHKDFMDHAVAARFDARILAFLEFRPSLLHSFKPDHTDRTFPCPRTWEFASRLITDKPLGRINLKLLAGAIGEGAAVELLTFLKVFDQLPSYSSICADPAKTSVPSDPGTLYATTMLLVDKFTRDSFEKAAEYAARLPAEFQVIYCRGIQRRDPKFIKDPRYVALRKTVFKFLTSDDDVAAAA